AGRRRYITSAGSRYTRFALPTFGIPGRKRTRTVTIPNPLSYLHDQLAELDAKGLHFRLRVLEGEQKPVAHFDGKDVINLSSNNYLGLTTHKALRRAAIEAIRTH